MAVVRSIGGIIPDVVIEETHADEIELTQHPVQQGAAITDHKFKKPLSLKMSVLFGTEIETTYKKLIALQESSELLAITTGLRTYNNMQIKSLSVTTNKETNFILKVEAELLEVIIVSVTVTNVPPRSRQKKAGKTGKTTKAGAKQTKPLDHTKDQKKKSALRTLFG